MKFSYMAGWTVFIYSFGVLDEFQTAVKVDRPSCELGSCTYLAVSLSSHTYSFRAVEDT